MEAMTHRIRDYSLRAFTGVSVLGLLLIGTPVTSLTQKAIAALILAYMVLAWAVFYGLSPFWTVVGTLSAAGFGLIAPSSWGLAGGISVLLWIGNRVWSDSLGGFAHRAMLAVSWTSIAIILESSGLLYPELSQASWTISGFLTGITGERELFGPMQIFFVGHCFVWFLWLTQGSLRLDQWRLLLVIVSSSLLAIATRQWLWLVWAVILVALLGDWNRGFRLPTSWKLGFAMVSAALLTITIYTVGRSVRSVGDRVGIVQGGLKTLDLPSPDRIEASQDAEFGALRMLLQVYGIRTQLIPEEFTSQDLRGCGVIIVINPTKEFSKGQQTLLERYVHEGGALLVLGDHTDIGGIMKPLNQLLRFTSMRFNFDSAIPTDSGWQWRGCLRGLLHPDFIGRNNQQLGISIGASLDCGMRSRVLVVGDHAWSDIGRPWFGTSRLGDMAYNKGEPFGGLVLVAEERFGSGVVQVWGDTSGFQDGSLTETHAQVVTVVRGLLNNRLPDGKFRWLVVHGVGMLAGVGFWLLAARPTAMLAGLLTLTIGYSVVQNRISKSVQASYTRGVAVLDASHAPSYPRSVPQKRITTLSETFLRRRLLLLRSEDFEATLEGQPEWWVIIAPTQRYSQQKVKRLLDYVNSGGCLLVVGGYDCFPALWELADAIGLKMLPEPYGAAHNSRIALPEWRASILAQIGSVSEQSDEAYDAEISFKESYSLFGENFVPLVTCWGSALIVQKRIGQGKVVWIGDSRFVLDENLGYQEHRNEKNIRFLLKILDESVEGNTRHP